MIISESSKDVNPGLHVERHLIQYIDCSIAVPIWLSVMVVSELSNLFLRSLHEAITN